MAPPAPFAADPPRASSPIGRPPAKVAPQPPANQRAFGHASVSSVSSTTATAGNNTMLSPGALSNSTSSASTVRSPHVANAHNNLRASTASNLSSTTTGSGHHLAPPFLLAGTSPGSATSASTASASAAPSANASPTPQGPGRQRSQSSASAGGAAQAAAERATQWLAALAPRGEGRSREFITSTLSGVATVASTVGQEVNGFIKSSSGGSRPSSFVGSPPEARVRTSSRASRRDSFAAVVTAATGTQSPPPILAAASATNGSGSANKSIPRPANMSRLGGGASHQSTHSTNSLSYNLSSPITSPVQSGAFVRSSTLPAPAPSYASPGTPNIAAGRASPGSPSPGPGAAGNAGAGSSHVRRSSQQNAGAHAAVTVLGHGRSASTGGINMGGGVVASSRVRAAGMPYKIGFQPSGVRHDRTAEFLVERKLLAADREKEEGRLGRRWAKLVDLHFNPATQTRPLAAMQMGSGAQRKTSLLSMDFDAINPKEVWKGLKMAAGPNPEEARKRAAEQTIVKWEDDADVRKCRICAAGFSLSNRKHHCRLCGRIVCSLPPTPPALLAVQLQVFGPEASPTGEETLPAGTRREKCSLLLVADYRTGRGEEVDEGFVGWMSLDESDVVASDPASAFRAKRGAVPTRPAQLQTHTRRSSASSSLHSGHTTPLPQQPMEVQVKGMRVCRDCWSVVSRKQAMADRSRVTPFTRLYVALRSLQSDIESQLPDFDDELSTTKARLEREKETPEHIDISDLVNSHKHLLALLGQYDAIAKRISALPCADGGSQATLQATLARCAATFLAKAMVQVHQVPKLERQLAAAKAQHMVIVESRLPDVLRAEGIGHDRAEEVAQQLQPLLEQQAQLEQFIAEANAQRKYDDARSLGFALSEIEAEIARLTASALTL